jgi:hypothetical protein
VHDDARQRVVLGDELSAQVAESDGLLAHDRLLPVWQTFDDVIITLSDLDVRVKHLFDLGVALKPRQKRSGLPAVRPRPRVSPTPGLNPSAVS